MNQLFFLGTGPAGGTKHGEGKSKRLESSALITTGANNILIDVTSHFALQSKNIDRIDGILITHGHWDAIGGIIELKKWQEQHGLKKIPLYSLSETIEIIKRKIPDTNHLEFKPIFPYETFNLFGLSITPFPVQHSLQAGFPTLGFLFEENKRSLCYASDISGWSKKTEILMKQAHILVIDGAMWNMKMPAHLDIPKILPTLCRWENKEIIFTQIGNTAPPYEILERETKKMCLRAKPSYDGMCIFF